MNIRSITLFWNAEERWPFLMSHFCTINGNQHNKSITITQNTPTFKIGFRAFLSVGRITHF